MSGESEGWGTLSIYILVAIVGGVIVIAMQISKTRASRRRSLDLQALAVRLRFSFTPDRDEGFAMGWGFLSKLAQGTERYAFNILRGKHEEQPVFVFEYHYQTDLDEATVDHNFTMLMLVVKEVFPQLTIEPEGLRSKAAAMFGFENINLESAEFSRTFCVRSQDKRFAYDVCNPQMIEYLLANRDLGIEIQGPVILLAFDPRLSAGQIEFNLRRLLEIRLRLPDYLFTKV